MKQNDLVSLKFDFSHRSMNLKVKIFSKLYNFFSIHFKGAHFVRERIANGREAKRTLFAVQSLQRLRGLLVKSHKQKRKKPFSNLIFIEFLP